MRVGLFPGQGIPSRAVLDALPQGDPLLGTANDILSYDLRRKVEIAARQPKASLPTSLAQPAIFTAGIASWRRAQDDGRECDFWAGHSLGEYAALVAGEAISFEGGLQAVAARGDAMQEAARTTPGGMAAILGLEFDDANDIAERAGVELVNDNAPGQVVLSGSEDGLAAAAGLVRSAGGRAVLLGVTGPYHTAAMRPAAPALEAALAAIEVREPSTPVVSNVTARPYSSSDEIRTLLVQQLMTRVRFRESLEWLIEQGADAYEDFGPGRVVAGLAGRTFSAVSKEAKEKETARA
jgi:[acyl-carrier-protein] S-malonyltransferase